MPLSVSDATRKSLPQALTASRLLLGAAAAMAAFDGRLMTAATFITIGAVFDGLDGAAARWLGACSRFGVLFDYFADYLCFVVAPFTIARALLASGDHPLLQAVLVLPLLTGAIRYAHNASLSGDEDLPGLGTVFFAFTCVAAVFLDASARLGAGRFMVVLPGFIVVFSVLMIVPVRYPKIAKFRGMSPAVLVLLAVMPFFATEALAGAMFVLGLLYAIVAPFFADRVSGHAPAHQVR